MHYTGTIWRPPFEAHSLLLQVTAGCTHDDCKFCSLYGDLKFRMSPTSEIEEDLAEASKSIFYHGTKRIFLTGANPFVLSFDKLKNLALLIKKYFPNVVSIGGFARITDVTPKTIEQLRELHELGYDGISIGTESGDDETLAFMNKGYSSVDIIKQCEKLTAANISYNLVYLTGLAGAGNGERNALNSAKIFNQTRPHSLNIVALTVFPESDLYEDIQKGFYVETGEVEKLYELKMLMENLKIPTIIYGNTVSNTTPLEGSIPKYQKSMVYRLQYAIDHISESELKQYRDSMHHL